MAEQRYKSWQRQAASGKALALNRPWKIVTADYFKREKREKHFQAPNNTLGKQEIAFCALNRGM